MNCKRVMKVFLVSMVLFNTLFQQAFASDAHKIRILHVVTYLKVGGVENQLYELLRHFKQSDAYENHVIYFRHGPLDTVKKIEGLGVPVHHLKGILSGADIDPLLYYRFKKMVKKIRPDVIHSGLWSADILSRLAGKALGIPVVCDIHADCGQLPRFRNWVDAQTAHLAARLVGVSNVAKKSYEECMLTKVPRAKQQLVAQRLDVIHNGVDFDNVLQNAYQNPLTRHDIGLAEEDFVFGYVCQFNRNKAVDILIKALAKVYNRLSVEGLESEKKRVPKLCLIGNGPLMNELKNLAQSLGIADKVLFMGHRSDVHRFYPLFDCYVVASHFEAISIALIDAMCFKLPLIATRRFLFHDIVENGKNGFAVPPGDCDALSFALEQVLRNQESARQMGEYNFALVQEKFTLQRKGKLYEALFKKVINEHSKA